MTAPSSTAAFGVRCPRCQAPAGVPCRSRAGKTTDTHEQRWRKAFPPLGRIPTRFTENPVTLRVTDWTRQGR